MVAPFLIHKDRLTGRTRGRPGLFGKFVLQVEVSTQAYSPWPRAENDPGQFHDSKKQGTPVRSWRDATWEDTFELALMQGDLLGS